MDVELCLKEVACFKKREALTSEVSDNDGRIAGVPTDKKN